MSASPKPVILTVDDDPQVLRAVRRDLQSEYAKNYRILAAGSGTDALAVLDSLHSKAENIALFLVDQRMPSMTGVEFLIEALGRFPDAKRVLLTAYAETDAAITAINQIRLDYYLMKPWDPPAERLFPVVTDLLSDWLATHQPRYQGIRVVGSLASAATHRARDFLTRNEQPFQFLDVATSAEAAALLQAHGADTLPLVIFPTGEVLGAPTGAELAEKLGVATTPTRPHYDTVIIGAGPAGLAAGVYGASEGLSTLVVDSDVPGGQAGTSSLIENYLGFPSGLSGADLARRAVAQARRFGAEFLYPVSAVELRRADPARIVTLSDGTQVSAESVVLAMGVSYNKLDVPGADRFENSGLFYGATVTESASCAGQEVFVVGGANSAGQAALHFSKYADKVTILVRGGSLETSMSRYLTSEIEQTGNIEVRVKTRITELYGDETLDSISLADDSTGGTSVEQASLIFTFIGALPHTDWLGDAIERDRRGFILTGSDLLQDGKPGAPWGLSRDPYLLETSIPGVFAAGDVRSRSVKRVASGVGEGAMALSLIHLYRQGDPAVR
jgi:thioredoxin reductase (NADPH)